MKDNKVDPDGVESLKLKVYGDADKAKVGKEMATECVSITDEDHCEAGYKIIGCMREKAQARGLSTEE